MLDNTWKERANRVQRLNRVPAQIFEASQEITRWLETLPKGEIVIPIDVQTKTKKGLWRFTRKTYRIVPSEADVAVQQFMFADYIANCVIYPGKHQLSSSLMAQIAVSELKTKCKDVAQFMWYLETFKQVAESVYHPVPIYYTDSRVVTKHRTEARQEIEDIQVAALLKGLKTLPLGKLYDRLDESVFTPDAAMVKEAAKHYCNEVLFYRVAPRAFASSAEFFMFVNREIKKMGEYDLVPETCEA